MYKKTAYYLIFIVFLAGLAGAVFAGDTNQWEERLSRKAVLLPFMNYTGDVSAFETVIPYLINKINSNWMVVYPPDDLRSVLRKYRIRNTGAINQQQARKILEVTGSQFIIMGSIDVFENSSVLEAGISVRILDASSLQILWASSKSVTGADYIGLFGLGAIDNIDSLAVRLVDDLFASFDATVLEQNKTKYNDYVKVAVIGFDNISNNKNAGPILTNVLVSQLYENKYQVIEPGLVTELLITNQVAVVGEIDSKSLALIQNELGADLLMTGTVDLFKNALGDLSVASPEASLSLRTLNARTGKIMALYSDWGNGSDSESFFQMGKCNSIITLSSKLIDKMLEKFSKEKKKELAAF